MSDSELAVVVAPQTFPTPILIERAGPSTRKKFFEFFTVPIRNANTRAAYYRAIQQFLAWVERAGYQQLEDIEPITVAAYIETLQRQAAPPTVKQHMAAIRMLFSWLTEKGVLAMNPAREVKTERFSRTEGKTPAFVEGEVQQLLDVIETVLVQFPINGCLFGKMIFWVLCRQDLRPERWNGHFFFGQRSEVELVFLDLLC
jgi:integrase